jgi:excisionase family DNA binding protein
MNEKKSILAVMGGPGYNRSGHTINEEWHTSLRGKLGMRVYREMADNDPMIGSALRSARYLMRQSEWGFCADEDIETGPEHTRWADFANECLVDMESDWAEALDQILSMMIYGYALMFDSYKMRKGRNKDPLLNSRFNDGLIGLRNIEIRKQYTIEEWLFDPETDTRIIGVVQALPPNYNRIEIPYDRLLHFRIEPENGNPEGKSLLRNCYRPYFRKTGVEDYMAIGIERDLAGYPVIEAPLEIMSPDASTAERSVRSSLETMVQKLRRDELEGAVIPCELDREGNPTGYKLKLLSSGGSRSFNLVEILKYYDSAIATVLLQQFLILGRDSAGSYALSSTLSDIANIAMGAIMDAIVGTINKQLVPRMMENNNVDGQYWPKFYHGDIKKESVTEWVNSMVAAVNGGLIVPVDNDERMVRDRLNLNQRDESDEAIEGPNSAPSAEDLLAQMPQPMAPTAPEPVEKVEPEEPKEPVTAVDLDDAAAMLNVSRNQIKNAIKRGSLPGIKIGNTYRVMIEDIRTLIKGGLL